MQAATVARALPRASACSARASQATLRVSGGPRRRDLRGALQVLVGFCHAPPAQGDAPGEQVRLHRLAGPGRLETGGDLLGVPEQGGGMLAGRVPGLGEDEAGARLPDGPPLRPEQPARLTCPLPGVGRVAGGQGGGGGREEQLRRLVRYPALRR